MGSGTGGLGVECLKERIQEEDTVWRDGRDVEEDRHGRAVERVGEKGGLYHYERVRARLAAEQQPVVARLVGRVAKDLEELGAAQVEHKLGVDGEGRGEAEGGSFVLAVVSKFGDEPDEHAINPPQDVEGLLGEGLMRGDARHQDGRRLLIEASRNLLKL